MKRNEETCPVNSDHSDPATPRHHHYLKPKGSYTPPVQTKVQLFARIKKSSEYYHQGLDRNGTPLMFKVEAIRQGFLCFRLGDNSYSSHDLAFYVRDTNGEFIPLAGGVQHG